MTEVAETPAVGELQQKRTARAETERIAQEELEKNIPKPVGFKLLIALPTVEETFDGGQIVKSTKEMQAEYVLSTVGLVLDMGQDAYTDKDRYPLGPWCKQGDYVMFRANSGTRFKIGRQEYRVLNEDSIDCVVPNPRAIARA